MLQQTQVKTVLPFWERWMRELPTIEAAAQAGPDKIHKLWEGLGYYTRVRNLQKAAQQIVSDCRSRGHEAQIKALNQSETPHTVSCKFPKKFEDVLALPGIGRYTAGAICSIAFNQPTPILDGNVIRVLTRIFGIEKDPREKETNARLWQIAEQLVSSATIPQKSPRMEQPEKLDAHRGHEPVSSRKQPTSLAVPSPLPSDGRGEGQGEVRVQGKDDCCSHLNQSLMELGALVCTPRNPQCLICPVKKLCVAFKENRTEELPNLGKREAATARHFLAFVVEHNGKFLVRQRPIGVVNAHLWEFPNFETDGEKKDAKEIFDSAFNFKAAKFQPLCTVKHSITRYRITLEAFRVQLPKRLKTLDGIWLPRARFDSLAFTAAHKKLASFAKNCILFTDDLFRSQRHRAGYARSPRRVA
jgi:A/G-specific adenine glycosylase